MNALREMSTEERTLQLLRALVGGKNSRAWIRKEARGVLAALEASGFGAGADYTTPREGWDPATAFAADDRTREAAP